MRLQDYQRASDVLLYKQRIEELLEAFISNETRDKSREDRSKTIVLNNLYTSIEESTYFRIKDLLESEILRYSDEFKSL